MLAKAETTELDADESQEHLEITNNVEGAAAKHSVTHNPSDASQRC